LSHSVYRPPRIKNCKGTIDNSYTVNKKLHDFSLISRVNVLSHGSGQYLILKNVFTIIRTRSSTSRTRLLCRDSTSDLLELLKNETWGNLYEFDDMQDTYNSFSILS
jgi:hypothetical protein